MTLMAALALLAAAGPAPAKADDGASGADKDRKWGFGIYGPGNQYDDAHPTLRWRLKPDWALDATPLLSFTGSNGSGHQLNTYNFGLDLGLVRNLTTTNGLRVGIATLAGYSYQQGSNILLFPPATYYTKSFTLRAGVGPDLEYAIPMIPRLTVGAHVFLRYSYSQAWGFNQLTGTPNAPAVSTHKVDLAGETLTVRYYF
jgi:hypothetical protein